MIWLSIYIYNLHCYVVPITKSFHVTCNSKELPDSRIQESSVIHNSHLCPNHLCPRNVNHRLSLWGRNVLLLDGLPGFPQFGPVGAGLRTFRLGWRTKISFLVHFLKQQVIDILSLNDFIKMILLSFIIFLTKSLNDFLLESHKESFKSLNVLE